MTKEISIPQKSESPPLPPQNTDSGIPNSTLVPTMGGAMFGVSLGGGLPGAVIGGLAGFAISKLAKK